MAGVVLFLLLFAKLRFTEGQNNAMSSYISTIDGKFLTGNALAQFQDTDSTSCALYCVRRESCSSVNYDVKNRKCFLMAACGVREFETASGFVFMEMVSIVPSSLRCLFSHRA